MQHTESVPNRRFVFGVAIPGPTASQYDTSLKELFRFLHPSVVQHYCYAYITSCHSPDDRLKNHMSDKK